jgi:septal ring factor EnvC (AmiA/AmiB activator)
MRPIQLTKFILLFVLFATHTSLYAQASSPDPIEVQQKLEALETEIAKFRELLESTEGQKSSLEQNLENNEKKISEILNNIRLLQNDLKKTQQNLSSLGDQQNDLVDSQREQQSLISSQIRASYELGNQPYVKVMLNQQDPNQISRMLAYYDHFNKARINQIETYEATIQDLAVVEGEILIENQQLKQRQLKLQSQEAGLRSAQQEKRKTLAGLNTEIKKTGSEIKLKLADREQLEAILSRITVGVASIPSPKQSKPFLSVKGKMLLPVAGKVSHRFGTRRSDGKQKWNGVFIDAAEGDPIYSIHYGRVVFSDWLRGFGLLLIINHGEGYMSLYGHNQVLYRQTGDWVAAGDLIANVGNSGGQSKSGLYFEIRNAGKPSNPQQWCQIRSQAKAA